MRIPGILVVLALTACSLAACITQQTLPTEAGPDQSAPFCTTNADCANGTSCSYEILVGCGAKGECRSFAEEAGLGACIGASTACGCDGKLVQIPACWMGFAPAPVLPSGQTTCGDAKSG